MYVIDKQDGQLSLVLTYSRWTADAVARAGVEARHDIEAALALGDVKSRFPPPGQGAEDAWYVAVFGVTEEGLEEARSAAVRRYRAVPWWRRKARRVALEDYCVCDQRLTVAHGLTKGWE